MRKLFIILLCFIFFHGKGQIVRYNDFAEMLFDRMTTQPADSIKVYYSEMFDSLQHYNLLQKLDFLYIHAAHEESAAYLNLVNDRFNGVESGNQLTFVANSHIRSVRANSSYLNSRYNPTDSGIHYSLAKGMLGAYTLNDSSINVWDIGCIDLTNASYTALKIRRETGVTSITLNSLASVSYTNSSYLVGMFVNSKNNDGSVRLYVNGVDRRNAAQANAMPDEFIYVCAVNNDGTATNFSGRKFAASFVGGGLTASEHLKLFQIIERYLDHKGVGVI